MTLRAKLLSGRWLITVGLTATIAYLLTHEIAVPDWLIATFTGNVILYYYRPDRSDTDGM
jgi:hypothetical protein